MAKSLKKKASKIRKKISTDNYMDGYFELISIMDNSNDPEKIAMASLLCDYVELGTPKEINTIFDRLDNDLESLRKIIKLRTKITKKISKLEIII